MTATRSQFGRALSTASGMTLIELLVALALVGFVATMLFGALKYGGRVWTLSQRQDRNLEDVLTAELFLRSRIERIDPFIPDADPARHHLPVEGHPDEVYFSAPSPQSAALRGLYRYRLFVDRRAGSDHLSIAWRLDRNGAPAGDNWQAEPLVHDIRALTIDYFEYDAGAPAHWVPEWRDRRALPALVRVRVEFKDADSRRWPELVVRPRLGASPNCEFDPVSRRCRS